VIDLLMYSWINFLDTKNDFQKIVKLKLQNFVYELEKLQVLIGSFVAVADDITTKLYSDAPRVNASLSIVVKPLFILKEKNREIGYHLRNTLKKVKSEHE
jgi:hypothetical protein